MDAFPVKRSGERLDYTLEVDDWLIAGQQLSSATAEIVGASNGESPVILQFYSSPSATISSSGQTSPAVDDRITVHLQNGTAGVTYWIKFTFIDDTSTPVAKRGVRYIAVQVVGDTVSETIVTEDGTQVPGANSYVTRAEADAYFTKRDDTVWLQSNFWERDAALVKAADYLEQKYRLRWRGSRVSGTQPLNWPRRGVPVEDFFDPFFREVNVPVAFVNTQYIAENAVPTEVKVAQFILARATMDTSGASNVDLQADVDRPIKRAKVGPLEVEYAGVDDLPQGEQLTRTYWEAEQTIKIFLKPTDRYVGQLVRS